MAVSWSYVRHLVHLFLRINCFPLAPYMEFFISASFFLFTSFFIFVSFFSTLFFPIILWSNSDGLGSCASRSDSLISLSYLMAVFSTKSFWLFFWGSNPLWLRMPLENLCFSVIESINLRGYLSSLNWLCIKGNVIS